VSRLGELRATLVRWLVDYAYPLWSTRGVDPRTGAFVEALDQNAQPLAAPRRARVHPRQIYAYAQAKTFGWQGDAAAIIRRAMDQFIGCYRRRDEMFLAIVDENGEPLDERALLYDQAFALLGYAAAGVALDARAPFEQRALELRHAIERHLGGEDGAYRTAENTVGYESNPHMHLLEAYMAWAEIGHDARWVEGVRRIIELALTRFIRKGSGALGESYLPTWQPTPGIAGRIIEPGHQFEWAWLLLRCERWYPAALRATALRLIEVGEQFGVHHGVAINALHDDFTIQDPNARLWPQSERLKAALIAAHVTGEARYWATAQTAAQSFLPYLNTSVLGLWWDMQLPSGKLLDSPAPASTFYHLVSAIVTLNSSMGM
jgi:mannose/cellobiose epimerase-like protein (N-acyl-D-glucosamine 2-epimerase family)